MFPGIIGYIQRGLNLAYHKMILYVTIGISHYCSVETQISSCSLTHSTKLIFLRFIVFFTVHLLHDRIPNYFGVLGGIRLYESKPVTVNS